MLLASPGTIPDFPPQCVNRPPWANPEHLYGFQGLQSAHTPSFGSAQALPPGSVLYDRSYEPLVMHPSHQLLSHFMCLTLFRSRPSPGLYHVNRRLSQSTSRIVAAEFGLAQAPPRRTVSCYSPRALPASPTKAMCSCYPFDSNPDWEHPSLTVDACVSCCASSCHTAPRAERPPGPLATYYPSGAEQFKVGPSGGSRLATHRSSWWVSSNSTSLLSQTRYVSFFMPVTRIGEASHPGPVIPMPGDGHCLYHAIGWWCHMPALAVRHTLANIPQGLWVQLWPEDPVHSYPTYIAETLDLRVWGGQQQIIVAAHLWQVRIHVHTPFGVEVYGEGPPWHLVYASDPVGHYDVLGPELSVPPNRGPAAPPNTMAPILPPPQPPPVPMHRAKSLPPGKPVHLGAIPPTLFIRSI